MTEPVTDVAPPDYDTAVGQVRALIPDVEQLPNTVDPTADPAYIFTDAHLGSLLATEGGNVKLAAAMACEVLGTSEALIAKVIKTEDLQTDGAKVMGQFLARARQLRSSAVDDETNVADVFEVVPYVLFPPQRELR